MRVMWLARLTATTALAATVSCGSERPHGAGDASDEARPCTPPTPNPAEDGPVLLSVSAELAPTKPILYLAPQVRIMELSTGQIVLEPGLLVALDASDRTTPVLPARPLGSFPIGPGGELVATVPRGITPGAANAVLPGSDIESELTLTGQICDPLPAKWSNGPVSEFSCGTMSGQLYQPVQGPMTGTFTIIRLADPNVIPAQPPYDCAGSLADPLP